MMPSDWTIEESPEGVRWMKAGILADVPGVIHGFSVLKRQDEAGPPTSEAIPGDFGGWPPESGAAFRTRAGFVKAIGGGVQTPRGVRQVHGKRIYPWPVSGDAAGGGESENPVLEGDARVARRGADGGPLLEVRMADCVPVLIAEASGAAVAAVHSGWRGTAAGIVPRAIDWFAGQGWGPDRLRIAIGPAICGGHYEVGPEVFEAVGEALEVDPAGLHHRRTPPGGPGIDLRAAIGIQLKRAGIGPERLSVAPWCTYEHPELFFSYRRQGRLAGRMAACVGWPVP